ncbi:ATP-binding cassette domain-containing protein [Actinomycetaceae bacterium L2_0104]
MTQPLLSVRDARIGYGSELVIDGLDLSVARGEVVAVTGSNGSGKSTLLRGLAGFQPLRCASFEIDGIPAPPDTELHRDTTYAVMDEWMWLRGMTVRDHFEVFHEDDSLADPHTALEEFGVLDLADRMPHSLSSGQLRRVTLASLLVRPWQILFIDEPEQRLDEEYQGILAGVLNRYLGQRAAVIATHASYLLGSAVTQVLHLDSLTSGSDSRQA